MHRTAAFLLLLLLAALALATFLGELLVLPATAAAWGTELAVLAGLALLVGLPFAIARWLIDRRHRATSKS